MQTYGVFFYIHFDDYFILDSYTFTFYGIYFLLVSTGVCQLTSSFNFNAFLSRILKKYSLLRFVKKNIKCTIIGDFHNHDKNSFNIKFLFCELQKYEDNLTKNNINNWFVKSFAVVRIKNQIYLHILWSSFLLFSFKFKKIGNTLKLPFMYLTLLNTFFLFWFL